MIVSPITTAGCHLLKACCNGYFFFLFGRSRFCWIWISAKKTAFLLRLVQDPDRSKWPAFTSFYERSNSGYAIKPKKTSKRQSNTKMQMNTLQVSLLYLFHLRKGSVQTCKEGFSGATCSAGVFFGRANFFLSLRVTIFTLPNLPLS